MNIWLGILAVIIGLLLSYALLLFISLQATNEVKTLKYILDGENKYVEIWNVSTEEVSLTSDNNSVGIKVIGVGKYKSVWIYDKRLMGEDRTCDGVKVTYAVIANEEWTIEKQRNTFIIKWRYGNWKNTPR